MAPQHVCFKKGGQDSLNLCFIYIKYKIKYIKKIKLSAEVPWIGCTGATKERTDTQIHRTDTQCISVINEIEQ